MENNFRFEKKFIIPYTYQENLINNILENPYRFSESYKKRGINNIYFDDLNFNSAMANLDGNSIRCKYRLRWYGQKYGNIKPVFEKKYKKGNVGNKSLFEINNFIFSKISNKFYIKSKIEKNCRNENFKDIIKCFNPVLFNSYYRKYYTSYDKKIRITIDYNIQNYRINSISHFKIPIKNNIIIMELKYNNYLSFDVSSISQYFPFRQQRFSKYIYGLSQFN